MTDNLTTDPAHLISHLINAQRAARGGYGPRGFVQADGTLRIVARSVAHGRIAYDRAASARNRVSVFEVRVDQTVITCTDNDAR
jgi:hypothetical protein